MTPEQQRIAIAEFCGWVDLGEELGHAWRWDNPSLRKAAIDIPDYLNDLNAMHEAIGSLIYSKRKTYRLQLQQVMSEPLRRNKPPVADGITIAIEECIDATAPQRAEAFLRTVGKWEENAKPANREAI